MQRYTYWEHTSNGHQKFWAANIIQEKKNVNVGDSTKEKTFYLLMRKWGKINTKGQSMIQTFNTMSEASDMLDRLVWDKEKKGYKGVF